jgi:murein DD-endopeptidase MepM/ murein hydrolase activator NlpD
MHIRPSQQLGRTLMCVVLIETVQYINPATWRSGLQRLKIGKSRTPLYKQEGSSWMTPYQITSGFGPRKAPTAGASTDHKGIDYGIAGGEPLFWEGPGTFKPGSGYGSYHDPRRL